MDKKECFILGYISKSIGNKGELVLVLETDSPKKYANLNSIFVDINETLVPFFISKITIKGSSAVLCIEGIDSIEKAEELIKKTVYLPLTMLAPLSGKKFYFHEMPGFRVIDKNYGDIGIIDQVLDLPQHAVFQIIHGEHEILIPANEQFIVSINRDTKELTLDAPQGLIDIYLQK